MIQITLHINDVDRALEIHEMSTLDLMKVRRLREDMIAHPDPDPDANVLKVFFYPVLKYASSGEVPTMEEFLSMSYVQSNKWYEAVDTINPGQLPKSEDESESEEVKLEKKG